MKQEPTAAELIARLTGQVPKDKADDGPIYSPLVAQIMREALGDEMFELMRTNEARKRREARHAANRQAWRHERAVKNGRAGGIASGAARRAKRDGRQNEA